MTTWITVCDTCRFGEQGDRPEAPRDGARLAALVEAEAETREGVRTRRTSCLMGCTHGCNVAVQAAGKIAYTLGRFAPEADAAAAIADYAALHAASETGQVPYRSWPQGVKGHFVTRHPPLPDAE
ncbi:DUF1636 family protein [Oceaniglobus roseus]|uniref:DUF1636 family protein n=1 Tax=Oceaniglobus roseus TaxID=1737570 RepID=UPI000C7F1633|nr:DUF1636 domain-containing protein [Kandeliimicrobium roseum]